MNKNQGKHYKFSVHCKSIKALFLKKKKKTGDDAKEKKRLTEKESYITEKESNTVS